MTSIVTLERKICMDSEYLDKNIINNIFKKIKDITNNECSKDTGYFLEIIKINKIKDNYISPNCENVFIVEFEAEILKPDIGKNFKGEVCMIFSGGVFLNIKNKLKVLIPTISLNEYDFNQTENIYVNKKDNKKKINVKDELTVSITGSKYSKKNFSCFGNLIE
jgi:DNA-directed RNA polymerase subunit E'/Rpb7